MDYFIENFDSKYYLDNNPDLISKGCNTKSKAQNHAFLYGYKEKRLVFRDPEVLREFKEFKNNPYNNNFINILIRNTYRPTYFKKCIESILTQTYDAKNIKIYICYDDIRCLEYLDKYNNNIEFNNIEIFKAREVDKSQSHFYNLYCNELLDRVKKEWILFLDDDDIFADKNALTLINMAIMNSDNIDNDNIFFWKVKFTDNIIVYPRNLNNISITHTTTSGFMFHSKYKDLSRWESRKGSDWLFVKKLLENTYRPDRRKFIPHILTRTIHGMMGLKGAKEEEKGKEEKEIDLKEDNIEKYNFNIRERNNDEIRLIYSGVLSIQENILEIIAEFQKVHRERNEVLLMICYDNIIGDQDFIDKINYIIQNCSEGLTFKSNLTHKELCYEIANSDIGISLYKNEKNENNENAMKNKNEINKKLTEYKKYGVNICLNFYKIKFVYLDECFDTDIISNNIYIINKNVDYNYIYIKSYSNNDNISEINITIDNIDLQNSKILLNNKYITPNYIDKTIWGNFKILQIHGYYIKNLILSNINKEDIKYSDETYLIDNVYIKPFQYTNTENIYGNKFAFIGDNFTYNSLNTIVNIEYISKKTVENIHINVSDYDFLLCESTWMGMDNSWKYAFNLFQKKNIL